MDGNSMDSIVQVPEAALEYDRPSKILFNTCQTSKYEADSLIHLVYLVCIGTFYFNGMGRQFSIQIKSPVQVLRNER